MTKGVRLVLFIGLLVGISWGVYRCKYYYSYYTDLKDRPWAYNEDEKAKLLVGSWQGTFLDPDGVQKHIELEILLPVTDEERSAKAAKRTRRRRTSRTSKRQFDGFATVTSKLGREDYEIYGAVDDDDWHQLKTIHFQAGEEKKQLLNNFNVHSAIPGGQWQDDRLTLSIGFTYTTATGSSYSSSADPRYEKKVKVILSRQTQ